MKKFTMKFLSFILVITTVFSLFTLSFVTYSAASENTVVSTDSVRLRSTPEILSGNVIGAVEKNEKATLLKNSENGWAYVQNSSGLKGYCSVDYLSVPTDSKVVFKGTTNDDVNFRKGPSVDYGVITTLSKNTEFDVIDNTQELWVKVRVQNTEGYLYRTYTDLTLYLAGSTDDPVINPTDKPQTPNWFDTSALDTLVSQEDASDTDVSELEVFLSESDLTIEVNDIYTLTAVTTDPSVVSAVTFSSSAPSVATVSANGRVKGIAVGSAVITASLDNGESAQCKITVTPSTKEEPLVLSQTELKIHVGNSHSLTANLPVKWKTSNSSVVTVSNGTITAKAKGEAIITAYTDLQSVECKVTVIAQASTISLHKTAISVHQGKTYFNSATSSTKVTWTSSNPSVAVVENGFITAVSKGTAIITAKNSTESVTCTVTVKDAEPLRFTYCKPNTAAIGETITLYALTDTKRTAVKFEYTVGGKTVTVNATNKVKDGNSLLWSGTTSVNTSGKFNVTAYSKTTGGWQTCDSSNNDVKTSIFVRKTKSLTTETMEDRRCTDNLIALVASCEGYSPCVYFDQLANGLPTLGYGKLVYVGDTFYNDMTKNEAYACLVEAINEDGYTSVVNSYLNNRDIYRNQQHFDALVCFAYNLGAYVYNNDSDFERIFTTIEPLPGDKPTDAFVNTTSVNVRSKPSTSGTLITTLSYGAKLTLIETTPKDKWYHVKTSDGKEGYIYADYVTKGKPPTSTLRYLSKINKTDFTNLLLQYHHAGSSCVWGLLYRRVDELEIFFYGDYVRNGSSNKYGLEFKCSNNPSTYL